MSKKTTDETLGREAVKEYLQQYHTAVGKKRILEERHRVLSSELRAPSTGSAFRLTPPTKPTKTDGSVSVVFRISEVEDRIEEQREEMAKAVLNVMDLIDVLPANSTERTVVEMRHIDCRGWDKIAEALYMSRWRNTWPGSSSGQGRTGGIIAPEKFGRFWTIDRAILIAWKAAQG